MAYRSLITGDPKTHLTEDHRETSQHYLTSNRRILFLRGPIYGIVERADPFSPTVVMDDIMALNEISHDPITLIIDSPGGDVVTGMALYDVIRLSRAPITTIGYSAASMATVILAAGTTRLALPRAKFMLHIPNTQFKGDEHELATHSKWVTGIKDELIDCYIECGVTAGLSENSKAETIKKKILRDIAKVREFWLAGQEAVDYGLIDRVVTSDDLHPVQDKVANPADSVYAAKKVAYHGGASDALKRHDVE